MSRYIDAECVDRLAREAFGGQIGITFYQAVHAILESVKPADVVPVVHGRWIKDKSGVIYCSECGEEHEWLDFRATYCDACGAQMDKEEKN